MNGSEGAVLITGASRGLGAALAMEFAGRGRPVGICARGSESLEDLCDRIRRDGGRCMARALDVADPESVRRWVDDAAAELGPPRILINNASLLGPRVPLVDYPVDAWREAVDVNLDGTFIVTRAVLPAMIAEGTGCVINVSSGAAIPPRTRWGAYAVSKAAVDALTLNLAEELEGTGVRVNAVDPGAMRTRMRADAYPDEDPARLKTPEETTGVFVWLASEAAAHVTGRRLSADRWLQDAARS